MRQLGLLLIAIQMVLIGCSKDQSPAAAQAPENQNQEEVLPADLSKMTAQEVLETKYDAVKLTCSLWSRMKGPIFLSDTPKDTVSIDLLKEPDFPKTIDLRAKSQQHTVEIQITLEKLAIVSSLRSVHDDGAIYSLKNTPELTGKYEGAFFTEYPMGHVEGTISSDLQLNENILSKVVRRSSGNTDETNPVVDYAECVLETVPKAAYVMDWQQTNVGSESTCAWEQPGGSKVCLVQK